MYRYIAIQKYTYMRPFRTVREYLNRCRQFDHTAAVAYLADERGLDQPIIGSVGS
jgi:transposase